MTFSANQIASLVNGIVEGDGNATVSTFAISEFLTKNKIKLFGTIIQENINSSMWNYGAALSLIMLIIIGLTTLFSDSEKTGTEGGMI